ncbi:MAG: hypothetical protein BGO01_12640 [Armatimonadetes bacterium 55-13]|nr:hypothetical protein [Armatimonadota bacterium]OJU61760.1 MAG: hypothetical protein BGO01_12640 [Armatimonadetes bacterium 55-13]
MFALSLPPDSRRWEAEETLAELRQAMVANADFTVPNQDLLVRSLEIGLMNSAELHEDEFVAIFKLTRFQQAIWDRAMAVLHPDDEQEEFPMRRRETYGD